MISFILDEKRESVCVCVCVFLKGAVDKLRNKASEMSNLG